MDSTDASQAPRALLEGTSEIQRLVVARALSGVHSP
jgi:alkylation response protein AidB-like acyl-CoA dehydrogenase